MAKPSSRTKPASISLNFSSYLWVYLRRALSVTVSACIALAAVLTLAHKALAEGQQASEKSEKHASSDGAEGGDKAVSGEEAAAKAEPAAPVTSNGYVSHWLTLPGFSGHALGEDEDDLTVKPELGRMKIIVFLASWCEPCQEIIADVRKIEERYRNLPVDFTYVFAHDTIDDASGFMKEYKIRSGVLANHEILKAYHNPELPTIYVGDRHGWLASRYEKTTERDLVKLDGLLKYLTAF